MVRRIEDYALIGNMRTAALVGRDGAVDWLCLPRFDSPACFAALLGTDENGRWRIAPLQKPRSVTRRYRDGSLILETDFHMASGSVRVIDFMPLPRFRAPLRLVRIVRGLSGHVRMRVNVAFRFDYGSIVPWVTREDHRLRAIAGPDALQLDTPIELTPDGYWHAAEFTLRKGRSLPFVLSWTRSYDREPQHIDPHASLRETEAWWKAWSKQCIAPGEWHDSVKRSAITLKALTHSVTGGIIAAPTTSLPEWFGGPRNWDYRYCWLRDASFTLFAMLSTGFVEEARNWQKWLSRAAAGKPSELQIMYGVAGERRLDEIRIPWLAGFRGSSPVRIGNDARLQQQMDIYGEVIAALYRAASHGLHLDDNTWQIELGLVGFLAEHWRGAGAGIWEQRARDRHFTHSKVMCWVAVDRAIKTAAQFGLKGPIAQWKRMRKAIHEDVCRRGFNRKRNSFVQYYGGTALDASLLLLPLAGFLPANDPRVQGTVAAIERELTVRGFVYRYDTSKTVDGLPEGEGAFLACSFWLADNMVLAGRIKDARKLLAKILAVRNDVGLLAEEYDPIARCQLGNFPQAFSHVGLINTARRIVDHERSAGAKPLGA